MHTAGWIYKNYFICSVASYSIIQTCLSSLAFGDPTGLQSFTSFGDPTGLQGFTSFGDPAGLQGSVYPPAKPDAR